MVRDRWDDLWGDVATAVVYKDEKARNRILAGRRNEIKSFIGEVVHVQKTQSRIHLLEEIIKDLPKTSKLRGYDLALEDLHKYLSHRLAQEKNP